MDDELALLAAVLEFPAEDAPRLIYADWLDDHGHAARAEFVRVGVELERAPPAARRAPRHRELLVRFRALLTENRAAWVAPFTAEPTRVVFRRGFIEEAKLTVAEVLRIGDGALAREPLFAVEVFAPRQWNPRTNRFEPRVPPNGDEAVRRLAAWPGRGRFRSVVLTGMRLLAPTVDALRAAPVARGAAVDVSGCEVRPGPAAG